MMVSMSQFWPIMSHVPFPVPLTLIWDAYFGMLCRYIKEGDDDLFPPQVFGNDSAFELCCWGKLEAMPWRHCEVSISAWRGGHLNLKLLLPSSSKLDWLKDCLSCSRLLMMKVAPLFKAKGLEFQVEYVNHFRDWQSMMPSISSLYGAYRRRNIRDEDIVPHSFSFIRRESTWASISKLSNKLHLTCLFFVVSKLSLFFKRSIWWPRNACFIAPRCRGAIAFLVQIRSFWCFCARQGLRKWSRPFTTCFTGTTGLQESRHIRCIAWIGRKDCHMWLSIEFIAAQYHH